jgi:hypothetical protein
LADCGPVAECGRGLNWGRETDCGMVVDCGRAIDGGLETDLGPEGVGCDLGIDFTALPIVACP